MRVSILRSATQDATSNVLQIYKYIIALVKDTPFLRVLYILTFGYIQTYLFLFPRRKRGFQSFGHLLVGSRRKRWHLRWHVYNKKKKKKKEIS